jgi:general secretion pathway protein I
MTNDQAPMTKPRRLVRRGLSLLEVILAIAILGGALAVLGQLIRIGARNAAIARDLTTAQLYCESKLNELAAGVEDPASVSGGACDEFGEWVYAVEVEPSDLEGLLMVRVTVGQEPSRFSRPVSFSLTRWIVDPVFAGEMAAQEAAMKSAAAEAQKAATETQMAPMTSSDQQQQ